MDLYFATGFREIFHRARSLVATSPEWPDKLLLTDFRLFVYSA